jgi:DivIVA domain-containing protein
MLLYAIVVGLVGTALFLLAGVLFGRSEDLPALAEHTTATVLPVADITAADVAALRFQQVIRGYKTSEVDWALERLAVEIESLREQLRVAHVESPAAAPWRPTGAES